MTFDEWYLENIVCGQPWGENKAYQDNHIYKAMKRAWDAGYDEGFQIGIDEGYGTRPYDGPGVPL